MTRLQNKVALISGAAQGIGAATACAMVAQGARVVIGDIREKEGAALASELGEAAIFVPLDVTDPNAWEAAVAAAVHAFGKLDILVNNAGISRISPVDTHSLEDWNAVLATNLTGVFNGTKAASAAMKRGGGGSIVNVSSLGGIRAIPNMPAYIASKFGVTGLTKASALDLGKYGIRVNSVHPGGVRTAMTAGVNRTTGHVALDRDADAAEIAQMIAFIASDDASYSTGAEFVSDGGESAGFIYAPPGD